MTQLDAIDIEAIVKRLEFSIEVLNGRLAQLVTEIQTNLVDSQNELDDYKGFMNRRLLTIERQLPKRMNPPEQSAPKSTINMTREEFDAVTKRYEDSIQYLGKRIVVIDERHAHHVRSVEADLDRFKNYVREEIARIHDRLPDPIEPLQPSP